MGTRETPARPRYCQQLPWQREFTGPAGSRAWRRTGYLSSAPSCPGNSFFKRVYSSGHGEAGSEPLGLLEGGRRRRGGVGRPGALPPSEAGDRKNLLILCAEPNMVLGLNR